MSYKKILLFSFCCVVLTMQAAMPVDSTKARAVRLIYDVDAQFYFDNREYKEPGTSQTIFGIRLSPEIGMQINDTRGGIHQLVAGVHYLQPIGGNWRECKVLPTAYYHYNFQHFDIAMGAIPYRHRLQQLPYWLMYDSIAYAHPNIQGALMSYQNKRGFIEFMCDWRGMQSETRREMFRLILDGQYEIKGITLGGFAQLGHKAKYKGESPTGEEESVCDDAYLSPQVGYNFKHLAPKMDTLALKVGYLFGYQRRRLTDELHTPQGVTLDLAAKWRFLGLKESLYYGGNLMPFYQEYGDDLNQGDPFYQCKFYSRTDFQIYFFQRPFANCYFSWNLHATDRGLSNQQQLIMNFNLSKLLSWNSQPTPPSGRVRPSRTSGSGRTGRH